MAGTVAAGATVGGCLDRRDDPGLAVEWTAGRGTEYDGNHHDMAAAAVDGRRVVAAPINDLDGSDRCGIHAVRPDGTTAWTDRRPPGHCTPHAVGDVGVGPLTTPDRPEFLLSTETGEVLVYDAATGERTLAAAVLDDFGFSAPAVARLGEDRRLVAAGIEGSLVLARPDGTVAWRRDLEGNVLLDPLVGDLDGDGVDEMVVAPRRPDRVIRLDADSAVVWSREVTEQPRSWALVPSTGGADWAIVVAGRTGGVALLDVVDGAAVADAAVGTRPRVGAHTDDPGTVFVGDGHGRLTALDRRDATVRWERRFAEGSTKLAAPSAGRLADGTPIVAVGGSDGTVAVCRAGDGEVLARRRLDTAVWVAPVLLAWEGSDDPLFVLLGDGRVARLTYQN